MAENDHDIDAGPDPTFDESPVREGELDREGAVMEEELHDAENSDLEAADESGTDTPDDVIPEDELHDVRAGLEPPDISKSERDAARDKCTAIVNWTHAPRVYDLTEYEDDPDDDVRSGNPAGQESLQIQAGRGSITFVPDEKFERAVELNAQFQKHLDANILQAKDGTEI